MSRLYDRNFALALASQTLFVVANAGLVHYARWITFLGGDERDVGWVSGVGVIASLLIRPWMGPWIDRVGDRASLAVGLLLYAGTLVLNLALTEVGPGLFLLRIATLSSAALVFASSLTYITRVSPPERRTEAIGSLGAGGFAGILAGPFLGDMILSEPHATRGEWRKFFLMLAASAFASLFLVVFFRRVGRSGPPSLPRKRFHFLRSARRHWPGRTLLVNLLFGVCMTAIFVFLSKFASERRIADVWPFFAVYAGWGLSLRIALRRIGEQVSSRIVVIAGNVLFAIGMASFLLVGPGQVARLVIPAWLCGTGHALIFHHMIALTLRRFPEAEHGMGSVLALMTLDLGQIVGAPLMGAVAHYWGFEVMFGAVGLACLFTAMILALPARDEPWRYDLAR